MAISIPNFNSAPTTTSKTPPVPQNAEDRRLQSLNPGNPENRIKSYKDTIKKLGDEIKLYEAALSGINGILGTVFIRGVGFMLTKDARAKLENLRKQKQVAELRLRTYQSSINPPKETTQDKKGKNNNKSTPPKSDKDTPTTTTPGAGPSPVIYNASAVKFAYFDSTQSLFNSQTDPKGYSRGETQIDSYVYTGNTPSSTVQSALELWKNSTSGKGMIQTWQPSGAPPMYVSNDIFTQLSDTKSLQRYGFQFIYNPGNISMSYGGVPDIDPSLMSSGTEDYLLSNPSVYKSTISFDILINRMFDMQYLGPGGKIKGDRPANSLYSGKVPTAKDLKKIYNRGTMYDIEFLLQTMFSYSPLATELRDKTSDIGYLGAFPVEMHLGNKLRYVVIIDSINVNHVIFDHRMVPLFSNVSISARRIPDYKNGTITDVSKANPTINQPEPGKPGGPPKAPPGAWQAQ